MLRPTIATVSSFTGTIAVGRLDVPAFAVPSAAAGATVSAARLAWPARVSTDKYDVFLQVWVSYDGGATWFLLIGAGTPGGLTHDAAGSVLATTAVRRRLKPERGAVRQLRMNIDTTIPIATQLTTDFW